MPLENKLGSVDLSLKIEERDSVTKSQNVHVELTVRRYDIAVQFGWMGWKLRTADHPHLPEALGVVITDDFF